MFRFLTISLLLTIFPVNGNKVLRHLDIVTSPNHNVCGIGLPPEDVKNGKLIVWLHGGMNSTRQDKGTEAYKGILPYINSSKYYLISPSAFREENWLTPKGQHNIHAAVKYMVDKYGIDTKAITLVGVSDGCLAVLEYSKTCPYPIQKRLLFSSYPGAVVSIADLNKFPGYKTGHWYFFQGEKDRLFPPDQVIPFLGQWAKTLPNTTLYIEAKGEHDFSWWTQNRIGLIKALF